MSDVPTDALPDDVPAPVELVAPVEQVEQVEHVAADDAPGTALDHGLDHGLDLDEVERDLADVELALARLDAGTYWTDEVTGGVIPDEVLAEQPTARRAGGH